MSLNKIRIITRNSQLAMWQATHVQQQLQQIYPELAISIHGITTEGDRVLDKSLDKIGGKGLFIKELEWQLLAGNADIAVHSLKDLPANLANQFCLGAVLPREDPRDALVSNRYTNLAEFPIGAVIGTSSARRIAFLRKYYPHLQIKLLRGNLQTRIAKLDNNEYDGIILASAGLIRLGLTTRICQFLTIDQFIPAIGQAALAIEICANNASVAELIKPLNDQLTWQQVSAEREMGRYLSASCSLPIAGHANINSHGELCLNAMLCDSQHQQYIFSQATGPATDYLAIGQQCAQQLIAQGADAILQDFAL
ncbi:MAG: hypothetical protein RLZZ293_579 [Pseudomonadota bacterium]|jgi:hydroxymethylbilane synthase